jgi:hypothetical protein
VSASGTQSSTPSSYHPARPDKRRRNRALIIAVIGVIVAGALFLAAAFLTGNGATKVRLGDNEFKVGEVAPLATRIKRDGPLLFQDLLIGGTRDIYVNHLGTDDNLGWVAFNARVPGSPRSCTLVWVASAGSFTDPCTKATVRADGGDLPHYPTRVTDGTLIVNLSPAGLPGQGPSTTSPSTTILVTGRLPTTTTVG